MSDLEAEFRRLHLSQLQTLDKVLIDSMPSRTRVSFCSFNCQSLRAYFLDMGNAVMKRSNFLLLTETWLHNDEGLDIPNFNFVVQFECPNVRAGVGAIYRNANDRANIVTPNMDINVHQANELGLLNTGVGDICTATCQLENGQMLVMVVIYKSNNAKIKDIIDLIHKFLLAYDIQGAALLENDLDKMPMIMSGDFNNNFNTDEAQTLLKFLDEKFKLKLNNDKGQSATRPGTTIDVVFSRYLENLQYKLCASYFSYYRHIIPFLEYELMEINKRKKHFI